MSAQEEQTINLLEILGVVDHESDHVQASCARLFVAGFIVGHAIAMVAESFLTPSSDYFNQKVKEIICSQAGKPNLGFTEGLTSEQCDALVDLAWSRDFQIRIMNLI